MDLMDQMNLFGDTLGFSADLFADDLGTEGSILDLGFNDGLKHQTAAQESLEELLLADTPADSLGEEWMETVDFQNLLNTDGSCETAPLSESSVKSEPRPEGLKQAAFDILKALLTGQQPPKTELSLDLLQPIETVQQGEAVEAISPVAEVPDIDFPGSDNISMLLGGVDNRDIHSLENLIQPQLSLDNGDVIEILPLYSGQNSLLNPSGNESVIVLNEDSYKAESSGANSFCDADVESLLSSGPTSPSETYQDTSTIDSYLSDSSSQSCSAKSIQVSSEDFTKKKKKSKRNKSKATPYDSNQSKVSDKRLRKKMQNKHAATRYREKKRHEKETLQEQEIRLTDTNKALKEKVESIQREIQYMKELMNEINKAKQSKI